MSTVWIRVTFGVVIALLMAFTVIFGITMVSPGPKPPGDPEVTFSDLSSGGESSRSQNTLTQKIDDFYRNSKNYRDAYPGWQRNVFLAATSFGVLVVLVGLALPAVVNYLRWGLVLGGALLLLYAYLIATGPIPDPAPSGSSLLNLVGAGEPAPLNFAGRFARFAVSFIGLILALFLGLWRLTEWPSVQRRPVAAPSPAPAPTPAAMAGAVSPWAPPSPAPVTAGLAPAGSPVPADSRPPTLEYTPARPSADAGKADQPQSEWARRE